MKLGTFFATTALAAVIGTAGQAQQLLASDPQTLVDFLVVEGFRPERTKDQVGDPMILFRYEGETEYLLFYDCTDHDNCLAVQFYAGYQMEDGVPLEVLNDWNGGLTRRFTRAFSSEDGTVSLEMDVATSLDGISSRDFRDLLDLWLMRKAEFEEKIGF